MKRLNSVETEQVQLEMVECDCGFHLGIDSTYLDQVGDCKITCPKCEAIIDTKVVFPEDIPTAKAPSVEMEAFGLQEGWNESTKLALCLDYLDLSDTDRENFAMYLGNSVGIMGSDA